MKITGRVIALNFLLLPLTINAADLYSEPQTPSSALASITGSRAESEKKKIEAFVLAVDGMRVSGEARNWSRPVHVAPGRHVITLGLGDLVYDEFEVELCAGCSYTARATYSDRSKGMVKQMNIKLWISMGAESKMITDQKPGQPRPRGVIFTPAY